MKQDSESRFYTEYVTREARVEEDRLWKVLKNIPLGEGSLLDIGCGRGRNLSFIARHRPELHLVGTDISDTTPSDMAALGFVGAVADASENLPFEEASFDIVLCGEVIEHVVNTDRMLEEIHRVLKPHGLLILTTPNLAYVPNRLLLLFGIQPLFTETSLRRNLGRAARVLGQGGPTQGHLKVFTLGAALQILRHTGFEVRSAVGYRFFQNGVLGILDSLLAIKTSFASGFVVSAMKVRQQ